MTKSRKLIIASVLLAGGYGLAIVLSSLTDYLNPSRSSTSSARSDEAGLLATLKEFVPHRSSLPEGRLIPEPAYVARQDQRSNGEPQRRESQPWNNRPTWLASTPVTGAEPSGAHQRAPATAPLRIENWPPEPAPLVASDTAEFVTRPTARITNVVGTSNGRPADSPSPWDRWPRWEPNAAPSPGGAVAASYQAAEPARPPTSSGKPDDADSLPETRPPEIQVPTIPHSDAATNDVTIQGRTHVVVDGDSLAKLADRYLDDPTLENEIFRLNRDVLTDPAVLPIGVELRIPDRRMADSAALPPAVRTFAAAKPNLSAGMVPVERTQKSFAGEPRAQLMRPIAAGRSD